MNVSVVVTIAIRTLNALTQTVPSLALVMMDIPELVNPVPMSMSAQITNMIATKMPAVQTMLVPFHAVATADGKVTELRAQTRMNVLQTMAAIRTLIVRITMVRTLVLAKPDTQRIARQDSAMMTMNVHLQRMIVLQR
jgi:hypothetical protein